jgi:microcystin-dependent protein
VPLDTFTSTLGTLVMGTGNDNNTWGTNANSFVFQILEDAIANILTSAVTGGTLDLSGTPPPAAASQARYAVLRFTGILASNQTVIVPNLNKIWIIGNATSGAFSLLIKTPTGTATQIPQGTLKQVICIAATNVVLRTDFNEIGKAEDFFTTSVPVGYLECDGSAISRTNFPDLFATVGTTWGVGDGFTTFNIPNLKDTGRFKRSRAGSLTVGTYQANQNVAHTHTGTTDPTSVAHNHGGATGGESASHTHTQQGTFNLNQGVNSNSGLQSGGSASGTFDHVTITPTVTISGQTGTESVGHTHAIGAMGANDPHTHTFTSASSGGSEARPEAAVVLSCIRY